MSLIFQTQSERQKVINTLESKVNLNYFYTWGLFYLELLLRTEKV